MVGLGKSNYLYTILLYKMSRFGKNYANSTAVSSSSSSADNASVLFAIVINPACKVPSTEVSSKIDIIESLRKRVKDLGEPNLMVKNTEDGINLYQTRETYGRGMSVEAISEVCEENDLTLRVTFKRPGEYSSATAFELSPKMLKQIVTEEVDDHGTKMLELRVKAEAHAENPVNGSLFVSIEPKKGGLHYFTNVDYKIMEKFDQLGYR